jgi:hypothetical protein
LLQRITPGSDEDLLDDPQEWNEKDEKDNRHDGRLPGVHEYGRAAATVFDGIAYLSNYSFGDEIDGKVYKSWMMAEVKFLVSDTSLH